MPRKEVPRPTGAELAILQVLWQRGPSTVREVTEQLQAERATGYTTTLKLLQIMADKRLVERDESQRSHVYRAAEPRESTQRTLVANLLKTAFGGSAPQLVLQALSTKRATKQELDEIRKLLDILERKES
jgi:predicted transcriptional regulator